MLDNCLLVVLSFLFCCNQLCQAALMKLLIQLMSAHCFPGILKDFYNLYFKISRLLCHRSYLKTWSCMDLICKRRTVLQLGDYRKTGLVLTISQMTLSKSTLRGHLMLNLVLPFLAMVTSAQLIQLNACYFGRSRTETQGQPLVAKTTLCFMLPQYGLWIQVILVGGCSIFWSLTPGLAKFTGLVKLTAAMTDGQ